MSSLRKSETRPVSVIRLGAVSRRALRYAAIALSVCVLSGIGGVSDVRPAAAQDIGRIIGGAIRGGLRIPIVRERHRSTRRTKEKNNESESRDDQKPVGDGKTFGSKGDDDSKVQPTKVGDGGTPKGQSSPPDSGDKGRGSGGNDKGPGPSEKPQGEAPNFTAR